MKHLLILCSCFALSFTFITPAGYPDLTPDTTPGLNYSLQNGNILNCYTRVNTSLSPINSFKESYYLSQDTTITSADLLVGTATVAISFGNYYVDAPVANIDLSALSVPAGTYFVGVFADAQNNITEGLETNNTRAFRSSATVFDKVIYPNNTAGIRTYDLKKDLDLLSTPEGDLIVQHRNAEELDVALYSLDGKLLFSQTGKKITLEHRGSELFLLRVKTAKGELREKILL